MEKLISELQLKEIKETLQMELLKRGFHAPIISINEKLGRSGNRIEFETEKFQTTPVLFKSIMVCNFNTSVHEKINEDGKVVVWFYVSVHAFYTHFGGGSNGNELFTVSGELYEKESIHQLRIA